MYKVIILPDVHLEPELSKAYQAVKQFIKDQHPDEIVLLGDFMDVYSFSAWDLCKKRKMENKRWQEECAIANRELKFLMRHSEKITYVGGNHEDRVERYLDTHPELEGTIEIPIMLDLKKKGIEYIEYENSDRTYKIGKLYFDHGRYTTQYFARKTLDGFGCNIVVGHMHKPQSHFSTAKMGDPKMCWALGTLGDLDPDYLKGKPSTSQHGFGMAFFKENGNFTMNTINMSRKGAFMYNGKEYK